MIDGRDLVIQPLALIDTPRMMNHEVALNVEQKSFYILRCVVSFSYPVEAIFVTKIFSPAFDKLSIGVMDYLAVVRRLRVEVVGSPAGGEIGV